MPSSPREIQNALLHVLDDESLARFIFQRNYIRSDQTVKPNAFIPHPWPDLSVTRHFGLTEEELGKPEEKLLRIVRLRFTGARMFTQAQSPNSHSRSFRPRRRAITRILLGGRLISPHRKSSHKRLLPPHSSFRYPNLFPFGRPLIFVTQNIAPPENATA